MAAKNSAVTRAMLAAIRHPETVRKAVSISAVFRHDGWVQEALDAEYKRWVR